FALVCVIGTILILYDLFTLKSREMTEREMKAHNQKLVNPRALSRWEKAMTRFELGKWLALIWVMGVIITGGLFAFGLETVRLGDPTIPYILAAIGYTGLIVFTILFAIRFLKSFEARQKLLQLISQVPENQIRKIEFNGVADEEEVHKAVLEAYRSLDYGEAFEIKRNADLTESHLLLYDVI